MKRSLQRIKVPLAVRRAAGGNLDGILPTADLAYHYARAIRYAREHGTPEDLEILSEWGRKHHDLICRA